MTASGVQLAATVGPHVSLRDVRQVSVTGKLIQLADGPLTADVQQTYGWNRSDGVLLCEASCALTVSEDAGEGAGPAPVFTAAVTFVAIYEELTELDLPDEAFEAFTAISASHSLHPYLREALQSLTVRAGLPAFVLATQLHSVVANDMEKPEDPGAG